MSRGQVVAAGLGFALFVVIALLIRTDWTPLTRLDARIVHDVHDEVVAHRGQLPVWRDVSTVLSPTVWRLAAVVAAAIAFLWRRAVRPALVLVVSVLGTLLLSAASKAIVDRDRPHFAHALAHASGQSYPSGHALTSFVAIAAGLTVCSPRVRRLALVPGVVIIAAVGYSRLALGVHYLSDIVGGWLLGLGWVCLVVLVVDLSSLAARVRA